MGQDYYLGLDIGTGSVGWAVTNEDYELCKFKKKSMWGVRLFESAEDAKARRMSRASRRRLERRKARIDLLQEIFSEEMAKIDESFFIRLNESRLHLEDKSIEVKYPLFIEKEYTDIDYYKEYPTIYHLRKELIQKEGEHDIRLVYLALHHIIKSRGHFLIDGDLSAAKNFSYALENMLIDLKEELHLSFPDLDSRKVSEIELLLMDKKRSRSVKAKQLSTLLSLEKASFEDDEEFKRQKSAIEQVGKLIVGNKGDLTKLLGLEKEELESPSVSFSELGYEEKRGALEELSPEKAFILDRIKSIYDWSVLSDILKSEDYISYAKVNQYEEHAKNLKILRKMIGTYCEKSVYKSFFNDQTVKDGYAAYVGTLKKNGRKYVVDKCTEEDFYKNLKGLLGKLSLSDEADRTVLDSLLEGAERWDLLPLQRDKSNATVPHQVHELELNQILKNASKYLPFLQQEDEQGLSNIVKIQKLFRYRVPYFVGPLSDRHKADGANVWMVRRQEGKIYPWNIEEMVDFEKSNEEFIQRMTNKCTYLIGEDVLPKHSLLYSKYTVLNELNNLKVRGKKVSEETKQGIFENLFKKKAKVSGKALLEYLRKDMPELKLEDLSGFDGDFKSSLSSYLDFRKKVFGEEIEQEEKQNIAEDIIKWITIYGNDKRMLRRVIEKEYKSQISEEQMKEIAKLRYSSWGNFSKKFLTGVKGVDSETGETFNMIDGLWNTNHNLMQLLSGRFTFSSEIDRLNGERASNQTQVTYDSVVKDLYVSPANKRAIWQTIQIAEEIRKVMRGEPKKIFIEMARGEDSGKKGAKKRTQSRKDKLIELYKNCEMDTRDWIKEIEDRNERDFNSMKLFLYYTQMGRCMYTGESIDLDKLMLQNSLWDRDHIYPQSKIKDDSIDNLVLVKKVDNAKKSNEMLSSEIQNKMWGFWKSLLDKGFISKKKYDRLTRKGDFTEDELAGFINRQLVETRQSSKALADVFKNIYKNSEIVYVKASLVSDFRKKPLNILKSRLLNDYHHAKDAYLNIVVGNVYHVKFTSNPLNWFRKNRNTNYSINAVFYKDVYEKDRCVWSASGSKNSECSGRTIDKVREIVEKNDVLYTEPSYCDTGELFNVMLKKKSTGNLIPPKKGLDPAKYGGYNGASSSYFVLVEFDGKKGERVRQVLGVPIYVGSLLEHDQNALISYLEQVRGMRNVKILVEKIKKNSLLLVNGYPMRIRGENEILISIKNNIQLKLGKFDSETVRKIEKYFEKHSDYEVSEEKDKITHEEVNHLYDVLLDKMETVYKDRPANQSAKLRLGREDFLNSNNLRGKMLLIKNLMVLFSCGLLTNTDLSFVGGSKNAGNMAMSKKTFGNSNLVLVNQSVTGLFENRVEL